MQEPEKKQEKPRSINKWEMANLAFELGFIIALPLVAFGLLGKWLDSKFGTEPWLTILGILFAIISTTVWLTRKIKYLIGK